eukprot:5216335-Amphidinium_carterae.1
MLSGMGSITIFRGYTTIRSRVMRRSPSPMTANWIHQNQLQKASATPSNTFACTLPERLALNQKTLDSTDLAPPQERGGNVLAMVPGLRLQAPSLRYHDRQGAEGPRTKARPDKGHPGRARLCGAAPRPTNKKPAYPSFRQQNADASPEDPRREISDDWLYGCWVSKEHAHGFYTFTDHRRKTGWYERVSAQKQDEYWRQKCKAQRAFQKIELQTSLRYYRKMTPANDLFKVFRCQAIVQALEDEHYECCNSDFLVFEGQEAEWIEELKHQRSRDTCPSNVMLMRRQGVMTALRVMKYGVNQPPGSPEQDLAAEVCHSLRIINDDFRDVIADMMYKMLREDHQAKKRYIPGYKRTQEWDTLVTNVSRNDAFESKGSLMTRRFNGAHCSYFP